MKHLLWIPLLALAACRSSRSEPPRRDFLSINRSSVAFVKETRRDSREMRRDNLRTITDWGARKEFRTNQRRKGRSFAVESTFASVFDEARNTWRMTKEGLDRKPGQFGRSIRLGWLDSGE